ncbi:MAG: excinuclease ABC subunit UvrC [Kiritimatiellia bacterium]
MDTPQRVREKVDKAPDTPGCYIMRDNSGEIIYVGKAVSLRKRLRSYFRGKTGRRDPKVRSLVKTVADIEYVTVKNEADAVLTEGRLIKEYRPRFNVSFRDDKRFLMLACDTSEPFPRLELRRIRRKDGAVYFGPYASSAAARATLDFTEKKFGLRKCAPRRPDGESYRHCINDIVRYCSAPCVGKASVEEYMGIVQEALSFLRGERPQYLREIRESMQRLAEETRFEEAAALRDTLMMLESAVKARTRMARTPEMEAEEGKKAVHELSEGLGISAPSVLEGYDVSMISGTYAVGSMVYFEDGLPRRNRYRRFRIKSARSVDDPGMMRELIRRRFERLKREGGKYPDLVLVDGGVTQLGAAVDELGKLGLGHISIAGLAKKLEEVRVPGRRKPLHFRKDSRALKLLQHLRDEAHRFALTYHRRLRAMRLKESVLDETPGIGPGRKRDLLRRFGSIRRLVNASIEEIGATPGIGPETARTVAEKLNGLRNRGAVRGRRC